MPLLGDALDIRLGTAQVRAVYVGAESVWTWEVGGEDGGTNLVLEFTISLAASDEYRSAPVAAGTGSVISATSQSDAAGTLVVETSSDLGTWTELESEATTAGDVGFHAATDVDYVRFGYGNGDAAQTTFRLRGWVD